MSDKVKTIKDKKLIAKKAPKIKVEKTIWTDLYTDLSTGTAEALREARIKPGKLPIMSDNAIMAMPGITEAGLEEIRSRYQADIIAADEAKIAAKSAQKSSELPETPIEEVASPKPLNKRHDFRGGKLYKTALAQVDRTKFYPVKDAVKLLGEVTFAKFDATVTLHMNLTTGRDKITRAELTFPYMAGAAKRVAIASDELIKDIESGKIEFDILVTHPSFMPRLAKFAKVLGPKGLMPSPKAGTVTSDPEKKAKEFAAGKTVIKAEPKFPLMHVTVGKIKQDKKELAANIQAVLDAVKPKNIGKAVLASTMSPGIKLQLS